MSDTIDVSIYMSTHLGDRLRETGDLSPAEYGSHVRLVEASWARGGYLPAEPARLCRLAGAAPGDWPSIWTAIALLWTTTDDSRIFHASTLEAIERARAAKASLSERGQKGRQAQLAQAKAGNGPATAQAKAGPPNSELRTPIPEPQTPNTEHQEDICPAGGPAGRVGEGVPLLQLVPTEPAGPEARKPTRPDSLSNVHAVITHYRVRWNHTRAHRDAKTSKARPLIEARLREGATVEELCQAIDGYHQSPHHQGQNDSGTKYLDLELFMRDETHVLRGIDFARNPPKPVTATARDVRVGQARAEGMDHSQIGVITP